MSATRGIDFPDVEEFSIGLVVFFAGPTTVSSGVVLTQQANGNYALALMLTVVTNICATFTIPPMLSWLGDVSDEVSLDVASLILKLTLTVLIPLIVGKMIGFHPRVKTWVKLHAYPLKLIGIYGKMFLARRI